MAEGWKQLWDDIVNTLRGGEPKLEPQTPLAEEQALPPEVAPPKVEALPPTLSAESSAKASAVAPSPEPAAPAVEAPPSEIAPSVEPSGKTTPLVGETGTEPGPPVNVEEVASERATPEPAPTPRQIWLGRLRTSMLYVGLAAVFIVGLWFAGGYRWWPQAELWWLSLTAPKPPASDVIATFDGGQITIADVEAHLRLLVPEEYQVVARTPDTLLAVVEDMVMDELVRRWATTRQPDRDEDFSHTMQHITESLNLESLDLQRHEGEIQVTESEIQNYYNANKTQFGDQTLDQVREQIRQTLVSQREQGYIEGYIKRLKDNASITRNLELLDVPAPLEDDLRRYYDANLDQFKLPRQVVIDETQIPIGGDEAAARRDADDALLKVRSGATFGEVAQAITGTLAFTGTTVSEGTRDPAWDAAVFALTAGELSDVFRAGDSFYVVRLNELQPARTQTLDEVRPVVMAAVQQQKTEEWFNANAGKTLFTLKGRQYTLGQFYTEYKELDFSTQAQYGGPEGMKQLAESLIERLLLVEDTYDQLLDVQNKPLVDEARLQVLKQMLHQEEIDDKIQVTDEELRKFYDENIDLMALPPRSRIRYIRIGLGSTEDEQNAARARADEAYNKLVPGLFQQGADFAAVAQEYSEDPETAANGGELDGWIGESEDILAEAQLHPFHEAILPLQPDEISRPFQFGDSLYIVQVMERTEPKRLAFEQARPYIEETLTQQKHEERLTQLTGDLFKQANVVVYETVLLDYFKTLPTPIAPLGAPEDGAPYPSP